MRSERIRVGIAMAVALFLFGCGGDIGTMIEKNRAMRDQIMTAIAKNPEMAGAMTDQLLASDSTRTLVIDRLMANGGARQAIMASIGHDQTMIDGVIAFAVQDSAMKAHVLTLLKGVEMAGAPPKAR